MATEDVFADAVLDRPTLDAAGIADAVAEVTRSGRSGWFAGLDQLTVAVTARRGVVAEVLGVDTLDRLAEPLAEAVRLEYRTLFADPDDLARLEEAELLNLPKSPAAAYRALDAWSWHSEIAEERFRQARTLVTQTVYEGVVDSVVERLAGLDPAGLTAMTAALVRLVAVGAEQPGADRPLAPADRRALAPLVRSGATTPTSPEGQRADGLTLSTVRDELRWRQTAQDRLLEVLGPTDERRLSLAWRNVVDRSPDLAAAVRTWQRSIGTQRNRTGDSADLAAHLFATVLDPIAETAELDQVERSLGQDYPGARLEDIDAEVVERLAGAAARRDLEELRRAVRAVDATGVRRRVPAMALRRGLTPRLRRQLGGPSALPMAGQDGGDTVLVVLVDRTGPATNWPGVRAAAIAVIELVHRHRPELTAVLVATGSHGEARTIRPADLLTLQASGGDTVDPARLVGALRRAAQHSERAALLVLGEASLAGPLARAVARWDWPVLGIGSPQASSAQEQTTATIRAALGALAG